jgi:hypothetical protein
LPRGVPLAATRQHRPKTELALADPTDDNIMSAITIAGLEGYPLKTACKMLNLAYGAVIKRVSQSAELRAADAESRQMYMRAKIRDMERIALKTKDVQRARLLCDNIKWEASRILRNEFGDHVTIAGDTENPLTMKLVASSEELLAKLRGAKVIEHDAED